MSYRWEIEDELQAANVFISGVDGRNQHMDSYMTVIDYRALDAAWLELADKYTREQWQSVIESWHAAAYLCVTAELTAIYLERKLTEGQNNGKA